MGSESQLCVLPPFGPSRLRPRRKRDQAAPFREAVAPEKAVELVRARIVDRLGLERLPFAPLPPRGKPHVIETSAPSATTAPE